jgi:hypothetical protein
MERRSVMGIKRNLQLQFNKMQIITSGRIPITSQAIQTGGHRIYTYTPVLLHSM